MRLLAVASILVMLVITKTEKLWECDFEDNDCWAVSSIRMNYKNQRTLHWNRWTHQTPTGATTGMTGPMNAYEGKHYLYYEASNTMDTGMANPTSKGVVTFKDINLMGRQQFILSFYYLAKGNDADFFDFDLMVSNTMDAHHDLSHMSNSGNDWKHFSQIMTVEGDAETISLKFTARSNAAMADYAIDHIVIEDYPDAGPCKNSDCQASQYCNIVNGASFECVDKCTPDKCGPHEGCILDKIGVINKCKCTQGARPRVSNYGDKLHCYLSDQSCDLEYLKLGKCTANPSNQQMYGHPSLWHGPYSAISGNGYYVFSYTNTITLDFQKTASQKLSFFYTFDHPNFIKSFTVTNIGVSPIEVPIHRDRANQWTLFEIKINTQPTQAIELKATFFAEGAHIGVDNIQFTKEAQNIVNKIDENGIEAVTYADGTIPSGLNVAMLFVTRYGKIEFGCLPDIDSEIRGNKRYCQDNAASKVCLVDSDCKGSKTKCVSNYCVCKIGTYEVVNPKVTYGSVDTSCTTYRCRSDINPCHESAICSNIRPSGSNRYSDYECLCPNDAEIFKSPLKIGVKKTECLKSTESNTYKCNDQSYDTPKDTQSCLTKGKITVTGSKGSFNVPGGVVKTRLFQHIEESQNDYSASPNDPGTMFVANTLFLKSAAKTFEEFSITFKTQLTNPYIKCSFEMAIFDVPLSLKVSVTKGSEKTFTNKKLSSDPAKPIYESHVFDAENLGSSAEVKFRVDKFMQYIESDTKEYLLLDNIECNGHDYNTDKSTPCDTESCGPVKECNPKLGSSGFLKDCLCPNGGGGVNVACPAVSPSDDNPFEDMLCTGHHEKYEQGNCVCDDGFERVDGVCKAKTDCGCDGGLCLPNDVCKCPLDLFKSGTTCIQFDKTCPVDCAIALGEGGYCNNVIGVCMCRDGYVKSGRDDGSHRCDKNAVIQVVNNPNGICSQSCGTGTVSQIEICVGATGTGLDCMPGIPNSVGQCNLGACPQLNDQCPIQKLCECNDVTIPIKSDGKLHLKFDHEAKLNMIFKLLSKHNQKDLEFKFREARCDDARLNSIARVIENDLKLLEFEAELQAAITEMKKVLDCAPSESDHNSAYWEIFDLLIELSSYRPHAVADLQLKKELVMHELSRCGMRTDLHKLSDGYAFWNKK